MSMGSIGKKEEQETKDVGDSYCWVTIVATTRN
jgi:hypothetical protein